MKTALLIAVPVIVGVGLLFAFLRWMSASVQTRLAADIRSRFDTADIIRSTTGANFFGEKSKGGKQIRGNGAFILTRDAVCFIRAMPFKEYVIPLSAIKGISLPKVFNGKTVFTKLLCIEYETQGGNDAMAWAIRTPEQWKALIEKQAAKES